VDSAPHGIIPECGLDQLGPAHLVDRIVVQPEFVHVVTVRPEHGSLDTDDFVLAARLLIMVVDEED
jgi:hypothetical protein